jgi:uncharacterized protein (TIGR00290 family)
MSKIKASISWSGGKDSAFALYKILRSGHYDVVSLHTVINEETRRVGMHGVHEDLIERQAESVGIPLQKIYLETSESHAAYEALMKLSYRIFADAGVEAVVFGDIFLEDLKKFREQLIRPSGVMPVFPLWKLDSKKMIDDFINAGFKTLICAANAKFFKPEAMGKLIDHHFVSSLPADVDACGENGEFHTFVYDGPIFKKPVVVSKGEIITKQYQYRQQNADGSFKDLQSEFLFQDLLPPMDL